MRRAMKIVHLHTFLLIKEILALPISEEGPDCQKIVVVLSDEVLRQLS